MMTAKYFGTQLVRQKLSCPIPLYLMALLWKFPTYECL